MSFAGLYTGLSGIRASQAGIDTASHNVSNANTEGYTRQRVELRAKPAFPMPAGQIGTGVEVEQIARLRDAFLDDRYRSAVGDQEHAAVRSETLQSMEDLLGEPDDGISTQLSELWTAAEDWANTPDSEAARNQVLTELSGVAESVNRTAESWDQLAADLEGRRKTVVAEVNDALAQIHDLNQTITGSTADRIGPDVLDQRDRLLDKVSEMTGATVELTSDNRALVTTGSTELVTKHGAAEYQVENGTLEVRVPDNPDPTVPGPTFQPVVPEGSPATGTSAEVADAGELMGIEASLDEITSWQGELDSLALELADQINYVHNVPTSEGGPRPAPAGWEHLMQVDGTPAEAGDVAASLTLNTAVSAGDLNAGSWEGAPPGDASGARALADLRLGPPDGFGGADEVGLEEQLSDFVVGLAGEVRSARNAEEAASGVASGAHLARAAEHGVSIDEEMVSLVQYQRALEANSRVMTTVDEMLDVLVNRTGVVGR